MLALLLVVGGLVAFRWDINLVGQLVVYGVLPQEMLPRYTQYTPSLIEILVAIGVISYGVLAFTLGVRYLKVVDHQSETGHESHKKESAVIPASVSTD
jgi:Ni/Fe-hydrogenase subunit HybB-like protein